MATRAENIATRLDNIAAELAAIDSGEMGGLANNNGANSVDHVGYRLSLIEEYKLLTAELSRLDGAWEVTSEMVG